MVKGSYDTNGQWGYMVRCHDGVDRRTASRWEALAFEAGWTPPDGWSRRAKTDRRSVIDRREKGQRHGE